MVSVLASITSISGHHFLRSELGLTHNDPYKVVVIGWGSNLEILAKNSENLEISEEDIANIVFQKEKYRNYNLKKKESRNTIIYDI